MSIVRCPAEAMSVFTIGTTAFIADVENVTVTIEVKDEDASAARDNFEYAWAVKASWRVEGDIFVSATNAVMLQVGNSVSVTYNNGAGTYAGSVLITQGVHSANKGAMQKQRFVMKGQGAPTLT